MKVFDWTIEQYKKAVLGAMNVDYEWYTAEMFDGIDKVTIQKIKKLVDESKEDPFRSPEEVVSAVCRDIRQEIEWSPSSYLKQVDEYEVPFLPQELGGGWMLEDYRFKKFEGGVFFSSVTAGDRISGAGRTFYIPERIRKNRTYEEFLDAYFDEIANPEAFGLGKEELIHDGMLKAFFGFTERKDHPEVAETDLPDMRIYFMNEYCRGDGTGHIKENRLDGDKELIQKEWIAFRKELPGVRQYAARNAEGNIPCYWGIMTDENVFRDDITFAKPWAHYFRTGYYLAAFEVISGAPEKRLPDRWSKRVLPARHYVVADAQNASPERYDELFMEYVNTILPEMGYLLSAAVLERIDPETGGIKLYFPVKEI